MNIHMNSDSGHEQAPAAHGEENTLWSEKFEAFSAALEMLYIPNNLSGRLTFMKNWPEAAAWIMGEALIKFDVEGFVDKEHRATLEQEALVRQLKLLELIKVIEENSIVKGALQAEYVEGVVKDLGHDLALYFYAPQFVERFSKAQSNLSYEELKALRQEH